MITLPRLAAALTSGLLLYVISPPMNLHFLHWVSFVPLLLVMREDDPRGNFMLGWLSGYAAVSTLFFWLAESIIRFSNIPAFLSLQVVHLFAFAVGLPYAIVFPLAPRLRRVFGVGWVFFLPAVQVAVEFVTPALFPYFQGVSQYRVAATWQLASVTGVYGVTYLVMLTNCAVAELILATRAGERPNLRALSAVVGLFLGNIGFGLWRAAEVEAAVAAMPRIKVSQIQQGITMEERMQSSPGEAMMSWVKTTEQLRGEKVDLVIWPEGATPYDPRIAKVGQRMTYLARYIDAPIVFGGGYVEEKTSPISGEPYYEQRNSIYLMSRQGELVTRYDKMVPLPFGEYIPGAETFPILREWIRGPGNFKAGEVPVVFSLPDQPEITFTTPICYEAILSRLVRTQLSDGQLMVNVTNDGWFGDTSAPHQHAMLSAVRAVELGVPIVRIAYTGVSMRISPTGKIEDETEPFTDVLRVIETPVGRVPTVYSKIGDAYAWLNLAGVIAGFVLFRRRVAASVTPPTASS